MRTPSHGCGFAENSSDFPHHSHIIKATSVQTAVMWSETVGLRTRPVSEPKIGLCLGLGLAGLVLFCETRSCYARHRNVM